MSNDQNDYNITPEEIEVEKIIEDATKQLEEIDYKIKDLDKKSGPSLTPSWARTYTLTPAEKVYQKKILANRKDLVKAATKDKVAEKLEKSALTVQLRGFNKAEKWAEPERDVKKHLLEVKSLEKDLSESQDVTMSLLSIEKKIEEPSFADRFNSSLKSNHIEPNPKYPTNLEDLDKSNDEDLEPEKD